MPGQIILFIDEAQKSRRLGSFVRYMKEEWDSASVILSGSLIAELHTKTERRPVGQESFMDLWPLSFKEFLQAIGKEALANDMEAFHCGDHISCLPFYLADELARIIQELQTS